MNDLDTNFSKRNLSEFFFTYYDLKSFLKVNAKRELLEKLKMEELKLHNGILQNFLK